jgi:hypothetical protein
MWHLHKVKVSFLLSLSLLSFPLFLLCTYCTHCLCISIYCIHIKWMHCLYISTYCTNKKWMHCLYIGTYVLHPHQVDALFVYKYILHPHQVDALYVSTYSMQQLCTIELNVKCMCCEKNLFGCSARSQSDHVCTAGHSRQSKFPYPP